MNIVIEIHYKSESRALQKGLFQLKGRKLERIALVFWKQIQNEMSNHAQLEKIIVDGDQDITQLVIDLEKQEWKKKNEEMNKLPF